MQGGALDTVSTTGIAVNTLVDCGELRATTPAKVPGAVNALVSRFKVRLVGAVPLVAERDAPGIPLTMAVNGNEGLTVVMLIGAGAGVGAVN